MKCRFVFLLILVMLVSVSFVMADLDFETCKSNLADIKLKSCEDSKAVNGYCYDDDGDGSFIYQYLGGRSYKNAYISDKTCKLYAGEIELWETGGEPTDDGRGGQGYKYDSVIKMKGAISFYDQVDKSSLEELSACLPGEVGYCYDHFDSKKYLYYHEGDFFYNAYLKCKSESAKFECSLTHDSDSGFRAVTQSLEGEDDYNQKGIPLWFYDAFRTYEPPEPEVAISKDLCVLKEEDPEKLYWMTETSSSDYCKTKSGRTETCKTLLRGYLKKEDGCYVWYDVTEEDDSVKEIKTQSFGYCKEYSSTSQSYYCSVRYFFNGEEETTRIVYTEDQVSEFNYDVDKITGSSETTIGQSVEKGSSEPDVVESYVQQGCDSSAGCQEIDEVWKVLYPGMSIYYFEDDTQFWKPESSTSGMMVDWGVLYPSVISDISSGDLDLVTVTETDYIVIEASDPRLTSETKTALLNAAKEFYKLTYKKIDLSSAYRSLGKQGELYYNHCKDDLKDSGSCIPPTGDLGLSKNLNNDMSKEEVIAYFETYGHPSKGFHTTGTAVDVFPQGSSDYTARIIEMKTLQDVMYEAGFCRITSEGWHYDYYGGNCPEGRPASNDYTYTVNKRNYDPTDTDECNQGYWNYKGHSCETI